MAQQRAKTVEVKQPTAGLPEKLAAALEGRSPLDGRTAPTAELTLDDFVRRSRAAGVSYTLLAGFSVEVGLLGPEAETVHLQRQKWEELYSAYGQWVPADPLPFSYADILAADCTPVPAVVEASAGVETETTEGSDSEI